MNQIIFLFFVALCCSVPVQAMHLDSFSKRVFTKAVERDCRKAEKIEHAFIEMSAHSTIQDVRVTIPTLSPMLYDKMDSERDLPLYILLARTSNDMLNLIVCDNIFGGNKQAMQKFYELPYRDAMLKLAQAAQAVKQNHEEGLTIGDYYGMSPALHTLYMRLNHWRLNAYSDSEPIPEISLHDEYLIQEEMSEQTVHLLDNCHVLCQLPYKNRLKKAGKSGLSCAYNGMGYGVLWASIASFFGSNLPYMLKVGDTINQIPALAQRFCSGAAFAITATPALHSILFTIDKLTGDNRTEHRWLDARTPLVYALVGFLIKSSSVGKAICYETIIGSALSGTYGIVSSLYEDATNFPLLKRVGEIRKENRHQGTIIPCNIL